jgi:hypothetical protein
MNCNWQTSFYEGNHGRTLIGKKRGDASRMGMSVQILRGYDDKQLNFRGHIE